jgi:hypothetical protein
MRIFIKDESEKLRQKWGEGEEVPLLKQRS